VAILTRTEESQWAGVEDLNHFDLMWIRIRIKKTDRDLHQSEKLDLDMDPHRSEKPDPDLSPEGCFEN
jgi:hypothetical protein